MHDPVTQNWEQTLASRLDDSLAAVSSLRDQLPAIAAMCEALARVLSGGASASGGAAGGGGGTIYTAGNGGSSAQSLHLAEELIGRYRSDRGPIRAVCLNADPSALTCIANDFGFEEVFARQARALVTSHDALVVFSTSGNSANIVRALKVAREKNSLTVGLLGNDGGTCAALCDHAIIVPAKDSAHIQDAHQTLLHMICERLESA